MRKLAAVVLGALLLLACGAPAHASHRHANREARAAQKRNKKQAKKLKREARSRQKAIKRSHQ